MDKDAISLEKRMKRVQSYISRMPSFSTTVTKVLEICNNPATSPKDLNKVISLDPVLTGKVLNLINSAYFALPNQITSLTRAIIMIGINTVKNLALSTAIVDSIAREKGSFQGFSMDDFWTHSICVGVTAEQNQRIEEFKKDADFLVQDAQYTQEEYEAAKLGWGHGTFELAVDMAKRAGVRRMALFHHDPLRTDEQIDDLTAKYCDSGYTGDTDVFFARESTEIDI